MHNENRFLDTFRGHNTRPISLKPGDLLQYNKLITHHILSVLSGII